MLHPKYRHLKKTSSYDKHARKSFIRQMMKKVLDRENSIPVSLSSSSNDDTLQSCSKKRKRFGEDDETDNVSDDDELERYLCKHLDLTNLPDNPLESSKSNNMEFSILSKVARQIFSNPVSTATVERSFSASGNIVTKRRTNIKAARLNNVLFLRSFHST